MIIQGKYTSADVKAVEYDEGVTKQLHAMLKSPAINSRVVIMPDTHVGKGSVIGFTMLFKGKVIPNVVGVDIGCGMLTVKITKPVQSLPEIDEIIRSVVPVGFNIHSESACDFPSDMIKKVGANQDYVNRSIGTLGGGNHFIELGIYDGQYYLTVHTGSRNLGVKVCKYHQTKAQRVDTFGFDDKMAELKRKYKGKELGEKIKELKIARRATWQPDELAHLDGDDALDYLSDMYLCQKYAQLNRATIVDNICNALGLEYEIVAESVHNYINPDDQIIRKGAISAYLGDTVIIPINRTFGTIIGTGKSNADWNYSAPHGAGRLMSRGEAKRKYTQDDADDLMGNVYSSHNPIDECDHVYKSPESIIEALSDTVDIQYIIKPILNIKG